MSRLSYKAKNALDEARMLILGTQVFSGFDFQATLQPRFYRLSSEAQKLEVFGLTLMLLAMGLFIAPGAYHQITERGNDTPDLIAFSDRIMAFGLLPFAIGIGLEVYVVTQTVIEPQSALIFGVVGTAFALFFWYVLAWIWRLRDTALRIAKKEQRMPEPTSLESKIQHVLPEARVVLPGAQALLGFQLAAMLQDAFTQLPKTSQYVHLASLGLVAITIVLLMAPAAFHRIVERGEDTERLHRFASTMLLTAMVPLAFGISADFYVVLDKVLDAPGLAITIAVASLVFFFGLWFGLTLVIRARRHPSRAPLRVSRVVR